MKSNLRTFVALLFAIATTTTCGQKLRSLDAGVGMSVSPGLSYILPGTTQSCSDLINVVAGTAPPATVQPLRLAYNSLEVDWNHADEVLTIARVKVTMQNPNIDAPGGLFEADITGSNLYNLIGLSPSQTPPESNTILDPRVPPGTFNPITSPTPPPATTSPNYYPGVVRKSDQRRGLILTSGCGFAIGGIKLKSNASGFVTTVQFQLDGFSQKYSMSDGKFTGEQFPVRFLTNATAQFIQ